MLPDRLTGFTPIPTMTSILFRRTDSLPEFRGFLFGSEANLGKGFRKFLLAMKSRNFWASGVPAAYSMPA